MLCRGRLQLGLDLLEDPLHLQPAHAWTSHLSAKHDRLQKLLAVCSSSMLALAKPGSVKAALLRSPESNTSPST